MYSAARWLLFKLDPERAHAVTLQALQTGVRLGVVRSTPAAAAEAVELFGLRFPNRVGLAAGFDKNARYVDALGQLGFGFIEVGTVTPQPQVGQVQPRVFRLQQAGALINRMGFPNEGVAAAVARLRERKYAGVCGVNIGKNATTPNEEAARDYVAAFQQVAPVADYVAINVSSPNTAQLRELQQANRLGPMLDALLESREVFQRASGRRPPLLVKISPDQSREDLVMLLRLLRALAIDGVIATNTTVSRPVNAPEAQQQGGLSGRPLLSMALATVEIARQELGSHVPIIAVGGIASAADARSMLNAGASLVQIYTALVYRGPALVGELRRALLQSSSDGVIASR